VKTLANGETLTERYEQTLARIEQLKSAGCTVKVQWECEFEGADDDLQRHPIVRHAPLNTRDALYEGRTEAMRLHYKIRESVETVHYLLYNESLTVRLQIFQVSIGHYHSSRGHTHRHRSLSKDGKTDEM